jgi:hypothetical protein
VNQLSNHLATPISNSDTRAGSPFAVTDGQNFPQMQLIQGDIVGEDSQGEVKGIGQR